MFTESSLHAWAQTKNREPELNTPPPSFLKEIVSAIKTDDK
jgi:hypothetical protein